MKFLKTLSPRLGVTLFEFMEKLPILKLVFQGANGEDLVILACTVFDLSTRVMDRQTDRQNCDG